jgi:hypothetical protein
MKLQFPVSDMARIAQRYEYPRAETDLINLKGQIQETGYLSKLQLRLLAQWKAPRSAGHIEKNNENYIKEITSIAFSTKEERSRIEVLTLLDGVRWPSASAILHLFHKEAYPILDFRALWSVGHEVPSQYSFAFWWSYVEFCRDLARRNNVSMRILDRALWQYSKENQKSLNKAIEADRE